MLLGDCAAIAARPQRPIASEAVVEYYPAILAVSVVHAMVAVLPLATRKAVVVVLRMAYGLTADTTMLMRRSDALTASLRVTPLLWATAA